MPDSDPSQVGMRVQGAVSRADREYIRGKVAHIAERAPFPVRFVRVEVAVEPDPARQLPVIAKAQLDVDGRPVRAHVAAATPHEAGDRLEARLRAQLEHLERRVSTRSRHRAVGEWRHGDVRARRPDFFPRPSEDRRIVRRRTYALDPQVPEEAVLDAELLDHDFYLFTNASTGRDNVVMRQREGGHALVQPRPGSDPPDGIAASPLVPAPMTEADAVALLDLGNEPFVFYLDPATGRGRVVYRRYDGHYGLLTAE